MCVCAYICEVKRGQRRGKKACLKVNFKKKNWKTKKKKGKINIIFKRKGKILKGKKEKERKGIKYYARLPNFTIVQPVCSHFCVHFICLFLVVGYVGVCLRRGKPQMDLSRAVRPDRKKDLVGFYFF